MASLLSILRELTTSKSDLESKISSYEDQIAEHVLKFLILQDSDQIKWAKEIAAFLGVLVKKQAQNNKYPKQSTYLKFLFNPRFESFDEFKDQVRNAITGWDDPMDDYRELKKREVATIEFYNVIKNFYSTTSKKMSQGLKPTATEVYNLLNI